MNTKSPYPEWINAYRKPGTEIRRVNGRFFQYEVSSYYDKEKKKGRKKTGKYLGTITQRDGFVAARNRKVPQSYLAVDTLQLSTKEYGLSAFIQYYCKPIVDHLKVHFPKCWQWLLVALYCRLLHTSPLKNMGYYFKRSFLSEQHHITVNAKSMSNLLRDLGDNRTPLTDFMYGMYDGEKTLLIDATSMVSYSKNLSRVYTGITKKGVYAPLFNLLYFYSPDDCFPAYYRLFNGNIKDVKMIEISTEESRYKNALVIADKGFYSQENLKILEKHGHKYIIPLKRSSALIESNRYRDMTRSVKHFLFEDRVIYYDSYTSQEGRMIYLFVDEAMMVKEKKDFICRMEKNPKQYTQTRFEKQLPFFGSLALITNKEDEPRSVYVHYKSRAGIEILFDGAKNILGNDFTYMQNDQALEGWMFINHLALLVHHKIYALLKEKKMIKKYSIRDFIEFLADVKKVRINQEWVLEPIIKEQKKLLDELGITIP